MAGQDDDGEKTVFGGQLPDPIDMRDKLASLTPAPVEPEAGQDDTQPPQDIPDPVPEAAPAPEDAPERTIFGAPLPDLEALSTTAPAPPISADPFETQPPQDLPELESDHADPTQPPQPIPDAAPEPAETERTIIGAPLPDLAGLEDLTPAPRPDMGVQTANTEVTPPDSDEDIERTIIGAALPAPEEENTERTVIGAALPLMGEISQEPKPEPAQVVDDSPFAEPDDNERTVIGEMLPPPDSASAAPAEDSTIIGAALPVNDEATILGAALPQVQQPPNAPEPPARPTLEQMLQGPVPAPAVSANPLMAAASRLLNILGQMRNGAVDMDRDELANQLAHEVEAFERNALAAKIDGTEAQISKYILCGTADDIIQSLPGFNAMSWRQTSMVGRFFREAGDSGIGVFQEAEKAMQAPRQRFNMLELFLCCLNLGFEGQYRHMENGGAQITRIRGAIYEALRRVQPRRGADLSATWLPVIPGGKKRSRGMPLWGFFSIAAAVLVAFYSTVSYLIHEQGTEVAWAYRTVHPNDIVELVREVPGPVFVAETPDQITRLQERLVAEVDAGLIRIEEKGDFIILKAGENLRFEPGSASVNSGLVPVSGVLAKALNPEPGFVYVIGHSDAQGSFTKNQLLSQARADAVADVLRATFADPNRLTVLGRGESEPIGDNATPDGRSLNRRVEILIEREGNN